jgi:hypothetical protein
MKRDLHFQKHGVQLGAADAATYETLADAFMSGLMNSTTRECHRPNRGNRLRFDTFNLRFGAESVGPPSYLKTFFIVNQATINYHGNELRYFGYECGRINA